MLSNLSSKTKTLILSIVIAIVIIGLFWLYWYKIVVNPNRVLYGALDNSLKTTSVTRKIDQKSQYSGIEQATYLSFFPPETYANTRSSLSQLTLTGETAKVGTETIGVNGADYIKYTNVSGAGGQDGTGGIKDLFNVWAKRGDNSSNTTFLNEGLFGIIPFGNLSAGDRSKLIDLMQSKNLYTYKSAVKSIENNRLVYTYDMNVDPASLVEIINEYMRLTGNGNPERLNPDDYKSSGQLNVQVSVDIFSRQLLKIEYPQNRTETYQGYGLYRPLEIPQHTIPVDELQRRIQKVQNPSS